MTQVFRSGLRPLTRFWLTVVAIALLFVPGELQAQARRDSAMATLETLVVSADRTRLPVAISTHAISVLTRDAIDASPATTLAEALEQVTGLTFVDFAGTGADPQLIVRGFYGGGEAEYALMLIDGRPFNAVESGRIAWDAIPLAAVERIEIIRGPAAAAWGDASLGAVINVITRREGAGGQVQFTGGSFGDLHGSLDGARRIGGRTVSWFGDVRASDGFRAHSERTTGSVGASIELESHADATTTVTTAHDWRVFDVPGPLTAEQLSADRAGSAAFYRFDDTRDRRHQLHVVREWSDTSMRWLAAVSGEHRDEARTRTIALTPEFADSKDRDLDASRLTATAQLVREGLLLPEAELLFGIDVSAARLRSTYYNRIVGPADAFAGAMDAQGDVHADGSGTRLAGAAFFNYAVPVSAAVRLSAGGRIDWLRDRYDEDVPEPVSHEAGHTAFSPRAGISVRYLESSRQSGHLWLNVSRSFKAPTLDQLFDQRRFPVPFPPFEIGFANAALEPQHGRNVEAGLYHGIILLRNLSARLSIAAYRMDLRDELDFDIATFRYQNLRRSRHRGLEAGLDVSAGTSVAGWARYTRQSATNTEGEHEGLQLKAVPAHLLTTGVRTQPTAWLSAALTAHRAWGAFIDDANTQQLPAWTRWDVNVGLHARGFRLWIRSSNLFDAEYSTTAYPDAADPSTIYYYPAAGRSFELGISRAW